MKRLLAASCELQRKRRVDFKQPGDIQLQMVHIAAECCRANKMQALEICRGEGIKGQPERVHVLIRSFSWALFHAQTVSFSEKHAPTPPVTSRRFSCCCCCTKLQRLLQSVLFVAVPAVVPLIQQLTCLTASLSVSSRLQQLLRRSWTMQPWQLQTLCGLYLHNALVCASSGSVILMERDISSSTLSEQPSDLSSSEGAGAAHSAAAS